MCSDRNYWLVNIECKDRNKLLFDTVCTLADLNYDVFHATIDSVNGRAVQEYYVRSRLGCTGEHSGLYQITEPYSRIAFIRGVNGHARIASAAFTKQASNQSINLRVDRSRREGDVQPPMLLTVKGVFAVLFSQYNNHASLSTTFPQSQLHMCSVGHHRCQECTLLHMCNVFFGQQNRTGA